MRFEKKVSSLTPAKVRCSDAKFNHPAPVPTLRQFVSVKVHELFNRGSGTINCRDFFLCSRIRTNVVIATCTVSKEVKRKGSASVARKG